MCVIISTLTTVMATITDFNSFKLFSKVMAKGDQMVRDFVFVLTVSQPFDHPGHSRWNHDSEFELTLLLVIRLQDMVRDAFLMIASLGLGSDEESSSSLVLTYLQFLKSRKVYRISSYTRNHTAAQALPLLVRWTFHTSPLIYPACTQIHHLP